MYTIREAADRAGVSSELLRAWERRYGVVSPRRSPSGYRLYDEPAIARVRAMRAMVDDGWTPSAAAEHLRALGDDAIGTIVPRPVAKDGAPDAADTTRAEMVDRFVAAAARMDHAAIQAFLDDVGARGSFEAVVDRYLFPALRALGEAWSQGIVSVAAEHEASAAVARWLGAAYQAAATDDHGDRVVLVGLPPGARHELGALAFATAARRAGLRVHFLGADLPTADWVLALEATAARAAVIGVPTGDDAAPARQVAGALHRARRDLVIRFGGAGSEAMPRASVLAHGPAEAASELRSLLRPEGR